MRELASLREGWDEIEAIETDLLRAMNVQESLAHWHPAAGRQTG